MPLALCTVLAPLFIFLTQLACKAFLLLTISVVLDIVEAIGLLIRIRHRMFQLGFGHAKTAQALLSA